MRDLRVQVGTIALQVREYEREGPAIVFLHFGGGNLMMWQRVVPCFQYLYRLLLVDLRDHGKSDKPQAGGHIDEMARDVTGVMAQLEIERAHIVGSSLGAEVGLSVAANYPARVISLVCEGALCSEYGPYGCWEGSEAAFQEHVARTLADLRERPERVFPSPAALVEASRPAFEKEGWWNESVEAMLAYDAFEVRPGTFTRGWQKQAMQEYLAHYFAYRFEDYYRRVQCPVLLLPGEADMQDERTRVAMQGLARLAKAKIVAVPGWVHPYGWLLTPEEISKAVLEFLTEVGG